MTLSRSTPADQLNHVGPPPETVLKAAEWTKERREELLALRAGIAFETVLSTDEKIDFLARARSSDFHFGRESGPCVDGSEGRRLWGGAAQGCSMSSTLRNVQGWLSDCNEIQPLVTVWPPVLSGAEKVWIWVAGFIPSFVYW